MSAPLVIAEAGVNHNGELSRALAMVEAAARAGADIVKFQAFSPEELVAVGTRTAPYQRANTGQSDQAELLRGCALVREDYAVLADACRENEIEFLCTAFEYGLIDYLVSLGMRRIKVASGEMTNTPALEQIAGHGLPVLLSTGMSKLDEVERAVETLTRAGAQNITLLHCTSLYPAPFETLNLRAVVSMREHFGLPIGYSDHSEGEHAAIAAAALGSVVLEKHFTLDRSLPGPDHQASLEPNELGSMIRKVRDVAAALGDGIKRPAPDEEVTAQLVRRSWRAAHDLAAGTVLRAQDLILKRPADGLPPSEVLVGRRLAAAISADGPIRQSDLAG